MRWTVYLAGEIHSDWRNEIVSGCNDAGLDVGFTSPELDHDASDACGETILGKEDDAFWRDHKAAKINAIRTRTHLTNCDLVVVRFGETYKQWNAAFDAGYAAALGKPIIVMHDPAHTHALKEVDAAAHAVAQTTRQVVDLISYVMKG